MRKEPSAADFYVGGMDAWGDDRPILGHTFVPVPPFEDLAQRNRNFLCGRRGAGKSAIAIMSGESADWDLHWIVKGESTTYGTYIQLVDDLAKLGHASAVKEVVQLLWRYIVPIVVFQAIVEHCERGALSADEDVGQLKSFLEERGMLGSQIGLLLCTVFADATKSLSEGGPSSSATTALLKLLAEGGFKSALQCTRRILHQRRLLLAFDTLESYRIYQTPMKEGYRGIIAAVKELSSDKRLENVDIRLFIPAEIYGEISREIPAKAGNRTVFLRWRSRDLVELASQRFLWMLKRTGSAKEKKLKQLEGIVESGEDLIDRFWYREGFFPRRLENRVAVKEDGFAYLIRHTQRRPRELIFLLNQIVEEAFHRGELPNISGRSVTRGIHRPQGLQQLLADILAPFDGFVDQIVDRAKSVFHGRSRVMTGAELKHLSTAIYDLGSPADMEEQGLSREEFIAVILRSGLIGLIEHQDRKADPNSGYCTAFFEYLMQDHVAFNKSWLYYVHPLLGDAFRMTSQEGFGVVYPKPVEETWLEEGLRLP